MPHPWPVSRQAGAINMGKVVTTEFATGDPSPTRNPWNPEHTPGGSSSGSAVSVASRTSPAALGTQTGGSTCRPASYNGIVGLKATYGRISRYGVIPVSWSLDTVGILVRSVEDSAILLGAMAGYDPNDPSSSTEPVPDYRAALDNQQIPPRIGLIKDHFLQVCDEETRKVTEDVAQRLSKAGATIEEVKLPESFANAPALQRIVMDVECAAFHEEFFKERPDDYGPFLRRTIEAGFLIPGVRYMQAQRMRRRYRIEMAAIASKVDALLTPSTPAPRAQRPQYHWRSVFPGPMDDRRPPDYYDPFRAERARTPHRGAAGGATFQRGEAACGSTVVRVGVRRKADAPESELTATPLSQESTITRLR